MLNGDATTQRIKAGNIIGRRLAEKKPPQAIIEEMYVRTICRKPSPKELTGLMKVVDGDPDKGRALEDVFWALLNTREFLFNH